MGIPITINKLLESNTVEWARIEFKVILHLKQ